MTTVKSYTDINQSKRLAEILPIESADMYYPWYIEEDGDTIESGHRITTPNVGNFTTHKVNKMILPCWSLAALFGVLPNKIVSHETAFEGEDAEGINDIYHKCIKPTEDGRYTCCYLGNGCKYEYIADNPFDACVAMVEKLHELNLL